MSMKELGFALDQSHLEPFEQLALIVIADGYSEYFLRGEAIRCVIAHTAIKQDQAVSTVDSLIEKKMIRKSANKRLIDEQDVYFIQSV